MLVPFGMRYFLGVFKSSVRNHPPMFAGAGVGLYSSIVSVGGGKSELVSASLISTAGIGEGAGSSADGEPPNWALGRQLPLSPQVSQDAFSLAITSEKPRPSVTGYQLLSYL